MLNRSLPVIITRLIISKIHIIETNTLPRGVTMGMIKWLCPVGRRARIFGSLCQNIRPIDHHSDSCMTIECRGSAWIILRSIQRGRTRLVYFLWAGSLVDNTLHMYISFPVWMRCLWQTTQTGPYKMSHGEWVILIACLINIHSVFLCFVLLWLWQ